MEVEVVERTSTGIFTEENVVEGEERFTTVEEGGRRINWPEDDASWLLLLLENCL